MSTDPAPSGERIPHLLVGDLRAVGVSDSDSENVYYNGDTACGLDRNVTLVTSDRNQVRCPACRTAADPADDQTNPAETRRAAVAVLRERAGRGTPPLATLLEVAADAAEDYGDLPKFVMFDSTQAPAYRFTFRLIREGLAVARVILGERGLVREVDALDDVLSEVRTERVRQAAKHGDQSHLPDGTGPDAILLELPAYQHCADADDLAQWAKTRTQAALQNEGGDGSITFEHILTEEWAEAIAERDPAKLRAELIQVAAVAVQWVEAIDRRMTSTGSADS